MKWLSAFLVASLVGVGGGCQTARDCSLTARLWNNSSLRSFREPAPDPRLALFDAESRNDILVQYDSISDRNDKVERRAYFLEANRAKTSTRKKPQFVDLAVSAGMKTIPVVGEASVETNATARPISFAVTNTTGRTFMLYRNGQEPQRCDLPVYEDASGTGARLALTPLAVTGDAAVVALALAVIGACALAQSGFQCKP